MTATPTSGGSDSGAGSGILDGPAGRDEPEEDAPAFGGSSIFADSAVDPADEMQAAPAQSSSRSVLDESSIVSRDAAPAEPEESGEPVEESASDVLPAFGTVQDQAEPAPLVAGGSGGAVARRSHGSRPGQPIAQWKLMVFSIVAGLLTVVVGYAVYKSVAKPQQAVAKPKKEGSVPYQKKAKPKADGDTRFE